LPIHLLGTVCVSWSLSDRAVQRLNRICRVDSFTNIDPPQQFWTLS